MKLSSKSFFHFTNKLEYLKNILENGFYPRYCIEKFLPGSQINAISNIAIPMTCFCDIPLSNTIEHTEFYGNYGIGLTDEWIKKNDIVPVHYSYENSPNVLSKKEFFENFNEIDIDNISFIEFEKGLEYKKLSPISKILYNMTFESFYIKEYFGTQKNQNGDLVEKKFYDEKEWRFIPKPNFVCGNEIKPYLEQNEFAKIEKYNELIKDKITLKINPQDIKYIILNSEDEIEDFINFIDKIYLNQNYRDSDISVLKTKIIDINRIKEDF